MNQLRWNPLVFGVRHGQVFLLFIIFVVFYTVRQNLTIAIISMTDTSLPSEHFEVFNWTSSERGVLLGTFFYGYVLSNPPSGVLASRVKTRFLISFIGLSSGILTLLFPIIASKTGIVGCCISRALLGAFQGLAFPCASVHLARWSTPVERAPFFAFISCGYPTGNSIITLLGGYFAGSSGGWPSVFYFSGVISLLFGFVSFWFLRDSPKEDERISDEERIFIESSLEETTDKWHSQPIPWTGILSSAPLWATVVTGLCHMWGLWSLGTMLPTYMKGMFNFDIKENGLYSSIPNFGMAASGFLGPIAGKYVSRRFQLSLTLDRKIWTSIAEYGAAICLAIIGLAQPSPKVVVFLLFIAEFCTSLAHLGYMSSVLYLSPNYAGILMGIVNGISQISALLAPTLIGFMLHGNGTSFEWSVVFTLSAGVMVFGGTIYNLLGSADVQPWNTVL